MFGVSMSDQQRSSNKHTPKITHGGKPARLKDSSAVGREIAKVLHRRCCYVLYEYEPVIPEAMRLDRGYGGAVLGFRLGKKPTSDRPWS